MVQINYDILFSINIEMEPVTDSQNILRPVNWNLLPTERTRNKMEREKLLIKRMGGTTLILASPERYESDDEEIEKAVFELSESLSLAFAVELNRPDLVDYLDLGPGPRDEDVSPPFPTDKKTFFRQVFPDRMPVYVLENDRINGDGTSAVVGVEDAIAPPVKFLTLDKTLYANVQLQGPLPATTTVSPNSFIIVENGEPKEIIHPTAFEYDPKNLSEGIYTLSGNKTQSDNSVVAFSGNVFLNGGYRDRRALAYLYITLPAGTIRADEHSFLLRFQERVPASLPEMT